MRIPLSARLLLVFMHNWLDLASLLVRDTLPTPRDALPTRQKALPTQQAVLPTQQDAHPATPVLIRPNHERAWTTTSRTTPS